MAIIGERPESGIRIAIERPRVGGPPWFYAGAAVLPEASFPVRVTVSEAGDVLVELAPSTDREPASAPPAELAEKVRLIVRAVYRQAKAEEEPPAWRIVRWRATQHLK